MADIDIRISVRGEQELKNMARRLREAGMGQLQKELNKELREAGRPVIEEIRAAARAVHVTGDRGGAGTPKGSTRLRARVASAVRMSIAAKGIRFTVQGSAVGAYGSTLAAYLDFETAPNWRHPVFGGPAWSGQTGQPYFFVTIRANETRFMEACERAMETVFSKIA